jgi:hypothetical protein
MILSALLDSQEKRLTPSEIVSKIAAYVRRRWSAPRMDSFADLDPDLRRQISADLAVSEHELEEIMSNGHGQTDLMPAMARQLGLNPMVLKREEPGVYRDLQRVCSHCAAAGRCRNDLAANRGATYYREYCLNAGTLDSLKAEMAAR